MEWLKYPDNIPPERIYLFAKNDENQLQIVRYINGKFDTYHNILYFCIPDETNHIVKTEVKKRGRKPKNNT